MRRFILSIALVCTALQNSCESKPDYQLQGIIGTDDSSEVTAVPGHSVAVVQKIDGQKSFYCNGVKLQDGKFLGALHCFKHHKIGLPIVTSGGIVEEVARENKSDLLVGQMVGSVGPSEGAKLFGGELPLEINLEAHWFDPFTRTWRLSKGHGKRSSLDDLIWHHDLDLNPGASGTGLFFVTENGERLLVGIHLGFAQNSNVGLVYAVSGSGQTRLPEYVPEGICVGFPTGEKDASGKPIMSWSCDEGEEGTDGGTGAPGEKGPQTGNPSPEGQPGDDGDNTNGPDTGSPSDPGNEGSPDDGGFHPSPGIDVGPIPVSTPGEGDGKGGDSGRVPKLGNGQPCHACKFFIPEEDRKTYFKPKCDQDSGFTGLFGDKTPSSDRIVLKGDVVTQTALTDALRSLAEKMLAEKKWKSPEGMPSKISQLSEETRKRFEEWLNKVIRSADDYYAMVISSLGSMTKPEQPIFNDTEEGIEAARRYLEFAKKQIAANPDEFSERRNSLLDATAKFLDVADINIKNNNPENAYISLQIALATTDVSLSLTPVVGWGKDVYEAWTGYSATSGKKLTTVERSFAIGGAVTVGTLTAVGASAKVFMAGTVVFKDAAKLAKTAEELEQIEKATQNLIEMGRNAEKAGVSAGMTSEGLRATQRVVSEGKHVETVAQDGRSMYKLKSLESGKPAVVSDGVNSTVKKLVKEKGYTNLDLMKEGYAPIGADGRQINLHHVFAYEPGPVIEMEATAHTEQFREFHKMIKESFRNKGTLAEDFEDFREAWWINRSSDFIK